MSKVKLIPIMITYFFYPSFLFGPEKYITRLAKQSSKGVSLILTRISSEIYQNYITSFYTNQSIWDIALIGLKCRIFKKENGQFPDRLNQLNIQQINKDSFNKFRPYKLKRIEQDIIIYGYGLNRKNGHAKNIDLEYMYGIGENEKAYDIGLRLKNWTRK